MCVKNEYPRPQFERKQWVNLNGEWDFTFDDQNCGINERWFRGEVPFDRKICVPFVYQSADSGIGDRTPHDIVWYRRNFTVDVQAGQQVILHFGAVDFEADVYVNGAHVKNHVGGNTPFQVNITAYLKSGDEQQLTVRVFDPHKDETIPRGKQFWEEESRSIWYTNSTGIWQTVWLETVAECYLDHAYFTPLFDDDRVRIKAGLNRLAGNLSLQYDIRFKEQEIAAGTLKFVIPELDFDVELIQNYIFRKNYHGNGFSWTPEEPNLFDVVFRVVDETGAVLDEVNSYFGFRKIHIENGMTYLNNKPYYQRLVLDQGYWPTGLMTAPDDAAFVSDITLSKEMGFNGCRKHQKAEDPRFLYWADKLGYLIWGECSAATIYSNDAVERVIGEWTEIVRRDYNHPSLITWVPLNESWGVPDIQRSRRQQHFSQTMYHYLHAVDGTRLVISNDGWSMTETDICAIHNYSHGSLEEKAKYENFKAALKDLDGILGRRSTCWDIYADGFSHQGQPVLLTEFGGIGFAVAEEAGWGYTSAASEEEFVNEYGRVMDAVYASGILAGFCYTQLTDVEQEINGLLTYDRKPKCDPARIRELNERYTPDVVPARNAGR